LIVEGGLHRRFEQRRLTRMLQDLEDRVIVCGAGRIGSIVATELPPQALVDAGIRQKYGVIIVEIKRDGDAVEFNPAPESIIRAGDERVVLGQLSSVRGLEESVAA
jgi:Trk K+ transport system NAD-binding subunit